MIPSTYWALILLYEQDSKFYTTPVVQAFVEFAVVVAVGGVGGADVAVAGFEEFKDTAFVDCSGTDVVGKGCGQYRIFAEMGVHGT